MIIFIDLFAGIGGFRLALQQLGARCVFSSEINKFAIQTYQANFSDIPSGDITKIDASEIPDHDILCAGFPCQPFSLAGKRKGFKDSRGNLFDEIIRIATVKQPKVIFLENVQGLISHDKLQTFAIIRMKLEDLGYRIIFKVLKASDYGLPQLRPRVYILAFKDIEQYAAFQWPIPIPLTKNVGSILEHNVDSKYTLSDKLWLGHQNRKKKHEENNNGFGFNLVNKNSIKTNTLSARYGKDGSEILIEQENKNPRKLTPRECARLMGFPDSFNIVVSDTQTYKQFGNSVAVPVIKAIGEQIMRVIK